MLIKRTFFPVLTIAFLLMAAAEAFAQPSDAELKKNLGGPKVISTVLHRPGARVWDEAYSKYVWQIAFTNKVKDPANSGLVLTVDGLSVYDIIGGKYVFFRNLTAKNSYEGIADLTAKDMDALVKQFGVERFLGNFARDVVGKVESIALSPTPKFNWTTPNAVSFDIVAVYNEKFGGMTEHLARTFHIRLLRDDPKSAWKQISSVSQVRNDKKPV